jgi:hypothetical protein
MIDTDPALRAEHTRNLVAAVDETGKLLRWIGVGILCDGRQSSVSVPSSLHNALSRIGILQYRVRACLFSPVTAVEQATALKEPIGTGGCLHRRSIFAILLDEIAVLRCHSVQWQPPERMRY